MKDKIAVEIMLVGTALCFIGLFVSNWLILGGLILAVIGGCIYISDKGDDG